MKRSTKAVSAFIIFAAASVASAAPGTYTQLTSGGLWGDTNNWSGGTVADGSGNLADFNTLNIAADNTVHLDSARTIGGLTFGDTTTATAAGWVIDNNGNAANILTLAGTTPTITVHALGGTKTAAPQNGAHEKDREPNGNGPARRPIPHPSIRHLHRRSSTRIRRNWKWMML